MISESVILKKFKGFADSAMPVLHIKNKDSYNDALHLLETLFEQMGDEQVCAEHYLIALLSHAITDYENKDSQSRQFMKELEACPSDVAVLQTLIEQHELKLDSLPEIGHKSLVSKILSCERQLTKRHIKGLSERFNIDPSLFF